MKAQQDPNQHSVLLIAFHYPPIQMSSGVHRAVAFSRYLAEHNWDVDVLTVTTTTYEQTNNLAAYLLPDNVNIIRCKAWDTARDLAFKGRYVSWMAQPDRWSSWLLTAVLKGWWKLKPNQLILSTYPIATAHIIGYLLHRLTGNQWIVDLRDPMLQQDYPSDPTRRKIFQWIEQKIVRHASFVMLTSPGAIELYHQRYPDKAADFWRLMPNGYDEKVFTGLTAAPNPVAPRRFTLLHSGTLYPQERDPTAFFTALQQLKQQDPTLPARLQVVLRASGHDALLREQIAYYQLADLVELKPAIDYRAAAQEILNADALLLLQAASCNYQTPAKAYEYIRARRPVLVLAPAQSDTSQLMLQSQVACQADLADPIQIAAALTELLQKLQQQQFNFLDETQIQRFSRTATAALLAEQLQAIYQKDQSR